MITKIRTTAQYNMVNNLIESYLEKATKAGGFHVLTEEEGMELNELSILLEKYEDETLKIFPLRVNINTVVQEKISELDLTQNKLAELFEISSSKLSKILTGKRAPDIKFLKNVHEKLGVDGNTLLKII
jgi:antitoxin component HigA of HigAB toxin-antitoxin module